MTGRECETTLGPYTLGERLGHGGMGQVFRAYDARLERWVAIKRLNADLLDQPGSRQRFRREARATAALQHASIVQVFDLVESDTADWIVMELVVGETLYRRLAGGPLELTEGLRVAASVAEGLAAAHASGILHRDLKSENVMLVAAGGVKILDFGIAKRLLPDAEARPDELTAEISGQLLGTLRAMSPEQSRGRPVDERSDLFALGVLLYEIFAGVSPFRTSVPLATLERVRTYQQPPLAEVQAVPETVSRLVDRLLEKSPTRRPPDARSVATTLAQQWEEHRHSDPQDSHPSWSLDDEPTATFARKVAVSPDGQPARRRRFAVLGVLGVALILLALGSAYWLSPPAPPRYVTVLDPSRGGQASALADALAAPLRATLVEVLLGLEDVAPLTTEGLVPLPPTSRQIGRAMASDILLASSLTCDNQALCRLELRRLHAPDGSVRWIDTFDIPPDDDYLMNTAIAGRLWAAFPESRPRSTAVTHGLDREVYDRFLALRRASLDKSMSAGDLLDALRELRQRAPSFPDLYRLEARVAYVRFYYTREAADLDRAFDLLDQALRLDGSEARTLSQLAVMAIDQGRLELADQTLARLYELQPGDSRHDRWRALLLEKRGSPKEALDLMRLGARRHPSWRMLHELASMEYRQGYLTEAQETLERLLEEAPGQFDATSFLAQLELQAGSLRRAKELYGQLIEHSAGEAELSNLALAHLLLGEPEAAERNFAEVAEMSPMNPFFLLNLADARQLLGREVEAMQLYRRVLERIEADADPDGWQQECVRAQALAHLGRTQEAAAAAHRALRLAPDNSQVAYEVSLVYTLIGETPSALVHAERALAELDLRWYSLPWFDDLREDPRFVTLMARAQPL